MCVCGSSNKEVVCCVCLRDNAVCRRHHQHQRSWERVSGRVKPPGIRRERVVRSLRSPQLFWPMFLLGALFETTSCAFVFVFVTFGLSASLSPPLPLPPSLSVCLSCTRSLARPGLLSAFVAVRLLTVLARCVGSGENGAKIRVFKPAASRCWWLRILDGQDSILACRGHSEVRHWWIRCWRCCVGGEDLDEVPRGGSLDTNTSHVLHSQKPCPACPNNHCFTSDVCCKSLHNVCCCCC